MYRDVIDFCILFCIHQALITFNSFLYNLIDFSMQSHHLWIMTVLILPVHSLSIFALASTFRKMLNTSNTKGHPYSLKWSAFNILLFSMIFVEVFWVDILYQVKFPSSPGCLKFSLVSMLNFVCSLSSSFEIITWVFSFYLVRIV